MKTLQCAGWAALVGFLMAGTGAFAAYLESDTGEKVRTPEFVPTPRPEPPVPPRDDNPLRDLVRRLEVGRPYEYRGITVFPLVLRRAPGESGIRSLDEALDAGWLRIREMDEARVSDLLVRNDSRHPVFLMAGQILLGGRQNRIVREDSLLPPDSAAYEVPVYCGEKERWAGEKEDFRGAGGLVNQELRGLAAKGASQGEIWGSIDRQLSDAKARAPTRSYQEIYASEPVRRDVEDVIDRLKRVPGGRTVGAVTCAGGRLLSCDLFEDPELFARLWDKICRAHAVDGYMGGYIRESWRRSDEPDAGDVNRFLRDVLDARMTRTDTPAAGSALVVSGAAEGRALIWRDRVVHAALFSGGRPAPRPEPVPLPRPWLRRVFE